MALTAPCAKGTDCSSQKPTSILSATLRRSLPKYLNRNCLSTPCKVSIEFMKVFTTTFMGALQSESPRNRSAVSLPDPPEQTEAPQLILLPEQLEQIVSDIKAVEFSPYLRTWMEDYEKVGQRGRFLWQWCIKGLKLTTLPCVTPELRDHIIETKMLSIFYGTLIDDIADREQDREMLHMAMGLGSDEWLADRLGIWTGRRRDYLETIARLWREVWSRCQSYPRFAEFESLLRFDNEQSLNAMRYALLVNQSPSVLNNIEHDLYQPHNMQIMFMASVDLCGSPGFELNELGIAREIFWHAQRMGRIGNMLTTWEREVLDRDFTSGVFAHSLTRGILNPSDLRSLPAYEIMSLLEGAECHAHFIRDWKTNRDEMARKVQAVRSCDFTAYLKGFEQLIFLHLASRGLM